MATREDARRWWILPGEVVTTIVEGDRVFRVKFEYDDGTLWGLRVGGELVLWDHTAAAMVMAPTAVPGSAMQQLRSVLGAMAAPRPGWEITTREQSAIDKLALGLADSQWMTGRKLRHSLSMTGEEFRIVKSKLVPRYVTEHHGNKGDYYGLTLPGLLRSSERSRARTAIEATLRVIHTKFEADPDVTGFSTEEVTAAATFDPSAGGFIDGVLSAASLFHGGHGQRHGHTMRMNYGVPHDVEDVTKCGSLDEFMRMIRGGQCLRVWPTAPMRVLDLSTDSPRDQDDGSTREASIKYDVTLSFAGEDRVHAEALAERLRAANVKVFYDQYEQANLWGKDLYEHLHSVYSEQATYCVVFVSEHYAKKLWTTHERKAAQERAFKDGGGEYILPIRIDETRLPGLADTIGYVNISEGVQRIADMVVAKLRARGNSPAVPTTAAARATSQDEGNQTASTAPCPELTIRFETKSRDRDASGTVVVHHYELVARLVNTTKRRLNDWYLEVELPTPLVEPGRAYTALVKERSDERRSVFRTSTKLPPIPSGDGYEWRLPYRVDDTVFWTQRALVERAAARARTFVDGALVVEAELSKIHNF
jgi:hypothetical protein